MKKEKNANKVVDYEKDTKSSQDLFHHAQTATNKKKTSTNL